MNRLGTSKLCSTSRSVNDRRVRIVTSAMERAIASPYAIEDGVAMTVAGHLVTFGSITGWFEMGLAPSAWDPAGFYEIVQAYALNVPSPVLDVLVKLAREMLERCEWWDTAGHFESVGEFPLPWHDEVRS